MTLIHQSPHANRRSIAVILLGLSIGLMSCDSGLPEPPPEPPANTIAPVITTFSLTPLSTTQGNAIQVKVEGSGASRLELRVDNTIVARGANLPWNTVINTSSLSIGSHEAKISAYNANNNMKERLITFTVTTPSINPHAPIISSLGGPTTIHTPGTATFNFSASATDGLKQATATLAGRQVWSSSLSGTSTSQPMSIILPASSGDNVLTLTVTIQSGTTASKQFTFKTTTNTTAGFPAAGTSVGSGTGVAIVLVSPNQYEVDVLNLINELRTRGTLAGSTTPRDGTCLQNWTPLSSLNYSGVMAKASRSHANYNAFEGFEAHNESKTSSPYYTAGTYQERVNLVAKQSGQSSPVVTEDAAAGQLNAVETVTAWLKSASHCQSLADPRLTHMGAGYVDNPSASNTGNMISPSWVWIGGYYP